MTTPKFNPCLYCVSQEEIKTNAGWDGITYERAEQLPKASHTCGAGWAGVYTFEAYACDRHASFVQWVLTVASNALDAYMGQWPTKNPGDWLDSCSVMLREVILGHLNGEVAMANPMDLIPALVNS